MPLTVYLSRNHSYLKFTLPVSTNYMFPPLNIKLQEEDNDFIRFVAPNENGLIPYPTDLSPILLPPLVPDPLTFIGVQHNFLLGNKRLILAPPTRYGVTTFSALAAESAHHQVEAQQQPIVNAWNAAGGWPAAPASPAASAASASSSASAASGSSNASAASASASRSAAGASAASTFALAFSGLDALPAFTASSGAHVSPPSPLPMSDDENDESDESDEEFKDENDEHHGGVSSVKDENRNGH